MVFVWKLAYLHDTISIKITQIPLDGRNGCEQLRLLLQRKDIMTQIVSGRVDRSDLVEEVEDSRSTVYRALDSLAEHDLVVEERGSYSSTPAGELLFREIERICGICGVVCEASSLLDDLPIQRVDPRAFTDAVIKTPSRYAPAEHFEPVSGLLDRASTLRVLVPTVTRRMAEEVASVDAGTELEIVMEEGEKRLRSTDESNVQIQGVIERGNTLTVRDRIPLGLVVSDDETAQICILVFRDGQTRATIWSRSKFAHMWGVDQYNHFRRKHVSSPSSSDTVD